MDNKNVFVAIALSMSVLLFWGAFVEKPIPENEELKQQSVEKRVENKNNNITPNINESVKIQSVSRIESINKVERIRVENNNIIGSISLKGGLIDDISFKKHKQNLENKQNIIFLNPQETEDGFFVETGWTSVGNKIKVPSINSDWSVVGNNVLGANQSLSLIHI